MKHIKQPLAYSKTGHTPTIAFVFWVKNALFSVFPKSHWANARASIAIGVMVVFYPFASLAIDAENIRLPDIGDSSGTLISPLQEKELGDAFFRNLHTRIKINQDLEIQRYIQAIGKQLVAHSGLPTNPFYFFLVLNKQINAFAGPGGYIGINAGLLLRTEHESELASVIAHEVAHITQRHLYRAFESAKQLSIPTAVATLAAVLLGSQSGDAGLVALMAIQASRAQMQINFTRDNEEEADRVGINILSKSNFNPRSMPVFFERLQQATRFYGQNIPDFLRTHPVTSSRIADAHGRVDKYPYKQYQDSQDYLLTQAKLKVMLADDPQQILKYFQSKAQQGTQKQKDVAYYGVALAHLKLNQYTPARQSLKQLMHKYPNQPQYAYALASLVVANNNYQAGLKLLEHAIARFPLNDTFKIKYITTLLKTGNPKKARMTLRSLSDTTKNLPLYYKLMAQTYAQLEQMPISHRYLAEYYYAIGKTDMAVLQIKLAKKAKGIDFYLQTVINERLRFFTHEEKLLNK